MTEETSTAAGAAPRRQLTLLDTTSIIVGIIIGSSVYMTVPRIASNVPGTPSLLLVWLLGGAFALIGSLCYAELATALPAEGGDYVYLSRAYGRPMGFMFAWCELWLVRPGAIGSLAFVFAEYADQIAPLGPLAPVLYAGGATAALTAINLLGVVTGKWTQNALTLAKVLGLAAVIAIGFFYSAPATERSLDPEIASPANWGLAMIFILYAYGGWNDMAFVGAEVREPNRNIVRALLLGTTAVTGIYVLINAAFVHALGLDGVRQSSAVAADVARLGLGDWGARGVSALVAISALGAINGMTFTGARIYYAMGRQHRLFRPLGVWSPRVDAPVRSLLLQGAVTLGLVIGFGWSREGASEQGFTTMANFTFPPFWFFLLLVGLAVIVLRWREPGLVRPFRTPGFPLLPLTFCGGAAFMLWSSCAYARENLAPQAAWTIGVVIAGVVASLLDQWLTRSREDAKRK
jgi:basic amino acid/polyamine antiporter, APA family